MRKLQDQHDTYGYRVGFLYNVTSQITGLRNYVPGVPQGTLGHMSRLVFSDLIVVGREQRR